MLRWIGEWVWALFAYACGRGLRIRKYRILRTQYQGDTNLVRFPLEIEPSRLKKLMYLWGFREIVGQELEQALANVTPATAPFLGYDIVEFPLPEPVEEECVVNFEELSIVPIDRIAVDV